MRKKKKKKKQLGVNKAISPQDLHYNIARDIDVNRFYNEMIYEISSMRKKNINAKRLFFFNILEFFEVKKKNKKIIQLLANRPTTRRNF